MSFGTLSRRIPFVIPSGVPLQLVAHGEKFWIENATGRLNVEVGDGNSAIVRAGFESPDLARFSKLVLTNETASEIRGVIWVGARGVKFSYPQNPPTILVPNSFVAPIGYSALTTVISGYATKEAPYSTYGVEPGSRRAFFVIGNRSGSASLILYHPNGTDFNLVPTATQQLIPSDCAFTAGFSGTSGDYNAYVGEFFYA